MASTIMILLAFYRRPESLCYFGVRSFSLRVPLSFQETDRTVFIFEQKRIAMETLTFCN